MTLTSRTEASVLKNHSLDRSFFSSLLFLTHVFSSPFWSLLVSSSHFFLTGFSIHFLGVVICFIDITPVISQLFHCKMLSRHANHAKLLSQSLATLRCHSQLRCVATTKNFINGQFVDSKTNDWIDLHNPVSCHFSIY